MSYSDKHLTFLQIKIFCKIRRSRIRYNRRTFPYFKGVIFQVIHFYLFTLVKYKIDSGKNTVSTDGGG
jgi:hypothetical protein